MSKIARRLAIVALMVAATAETGLGQDSTELPSFATILNLVDGYLGPQSGRSASDLITQNDVKPLIQQFETAGWTIEHKDELFDKLLSPGDPIVRILRSPSGAKFVKQVGSYKLIYDRLDRVANEPGGQRLLIDMMKLPDAARFAKQKTAPGVPDMIDFLPKDRSGKTRRVKDYDKATGKIYVLADLKKVLKEMYDEATRSATP